jgi:hypothetical protein
MASSPVVYIMMLRHMVHHRCNCMSITPAVGGCSEQGAVGVADSALRALECLLLGVVQVDVTAGGLQHKTHRILVIASCSAAWSS